MKLSCNNWKTNAFLPPKLPPSLSHTWYTQYEYFLRAKNSCRFVTTAILYEERHRTIEGLVIVERTIDDCTSTFQASIL